MGDALGRPGSHAGPSPVTRPVPVPPAGPTALTPPDTHGGTPAAAAPRLTSTRAGDQDHPAVEPQLRSHESGPQGRSQQQTGATGLGQRGQGAWRGREAGRDLPVSGDRASPSFPECACAGFPRPPGNCSPMDSTRWENWPERFLV